jgi:hypothetical protein
VDHTVVFDDGLTMRFDRCARCLAPVYWIDLIEVDGLPRCVGLCQRCLATLRQRGAAERSAQEA